MWTPQKTTDGKSTGYALGWASRISSAFSWPPTQAGNKARAPRLSSSRPARRGRRAGKHGWGGRWPPGRRYPQARCRPPAHNSLNGDRPPYTSVRLSKYCAASGNAAASNTARTRDPTETRSAGRTVCCSSAKSQVQRTAWQIEVQRNGDELSKDQVHAHYPAV